MASKNKLLSPGTVKGFKLDVEDVVETAPVSKIDVSVSKKAPAWRYHKTMPQGMIVKTDEELAQLDKAGWKDHPGKVTRLPGFENLYEGDD